MHYVFATSRTRHCGTSVVHLVNCWQSAPIGFLAKCVVQRCITYSPPAERDTAEPQLYTSLIVGRAHQLDFWQNALCKDALRIRHQPNATLRNLSCTPR